MMQVDDMQGLAFDEHAWAVEHFLLNDPKVQQQLFKYLILPAKDLEKEGMPSNANPNQQQSWILQKAAADYTAFVASTAQLALSICPDITVDHNLRLLALLLSSTPSSWVIHCSNGLTAQ